MLEPTAQTFPLPRLPRELQLLVLQECLTSKTPLLDLGIKPSRVHLTVIDEPLGQDDICFAILRTCKFYREEGLKLLYTHNQFTFTEIFETRQNWWSQIPGIPKEIEPNDPTQHFPNLKQLILRTMGMIEYLGSWVRIFEAISSPSRPENENADSEIVDRLLLWLASTY